MEKDKSHCGPFSDFCGKSSLFRKVWCFYRDGFRSMTWGRTLWLIILIKLFIMFAVLKVFFFPDYLKGKTENEKQEFVGSELIERRQP